MGRHTAPSTAKIGRYFIALPPWLARLRLAAEESKEIVAQAEATGGAFRRDPARMSWTIANRWRRSFGQSRTDTGHWATALRLDVDSEYQGRDRSGVSPLRHLACRQTRFSSRTGRAERSVRDLPAL